MRVKGVVVIGPAASPSVTGTCTERVANRAIVCHVLESLAAAGIDELAVVCPEGAIPIARATVDIELKTAPAIAWMTDDGADGLRGALAVAAPFVGDDACILHPADGLIGGELGGFAELGSASPPDLLLLLHRSRDEQDRLGPATRKLLGVTDIDGSRRRLAPTGVCVFGPGALRRATSALAAGSRAADSRNGDGAGDGPLAVAQALAGDGRPLEAGVVRNWRSYHGDPQDLLELNRIVLDQLPAQAERPDRGKNHIEGRVMIDPTAEITGSTVLGPSIVGPHARICDSYIGPYTAIGAGAEIENTEIVRSIVSEGARIRHVNGRIEGSTIGRDARIFRDFALPRAMRLHVGAGVELALN